MIRRPGSSRWAPAGIALLLLLNAAGADEHPPSSQPLTNEDIVRLVINGTEERVILEEISARPVDFDLDEEVVVELRLVGVNETAGFRPAMFDWPERINSTPENQALTDR